MPSYLGSFAANTSVGNQAITGVGFQPDLVFFISTAQTAAGDVTDKGSVGFGFMGEQNVVRDVQGVKAWFETDNLATPETFKSPLTANTSSSVYSITDFVLPSSISWGNALPVSMDSDGFTISWSTAPPVGLLVSYVAFTVELQAAYEFGVPSVLGSTVKVTTNDATTNVAFQPTAVLNTGDTGIDNGGFPDNAAEFSLGAATSATDRVMMDAMSGNHVSSVKRSVTSHQWTDAFFSTVFNFPSLLWGEKVDISSFDSDGFTVINDGQDSGNTGGVVKYLAIKTPFAKVGSDTQKTSTGTRSVTGLGFRPDVVLFWSYGQIASTSWSVNSANISLGICDGISSHAAWAGGVADSDPTQVGSSRRTDKALVFVDTPGTAVAEASCTLNSDGFTLNWSVSDGTPRQFLYFALQSYPATGAFVSFDIEFPR